MNISTDLGVQLLGLALAGGWNVLRGWPVPWGYVLVFGGLGVAALVWLRWPVSIVASTSSSSTAN